jgi:hypothetical protein
MQTTTNELKLIAGLHRRSQELAARRVEDDPAVQKWYVAKRIVWMALLAAAFLIYYLIGKLLEALSILG